MKLKNPTNNKIEVQINGQLYSVEANSSVILPKDIALHWKNKIHQFMELSEVVKEVIIEEKVESIEEVKPIVKEETIEKPKKIIKIKKIK